MFKGAFHEYTDYKELLRNTDQTQVFIHYGVYPERKKYYKSIFRKDKNAGCRFEVHDGILYFIDNAGYNGHLAFDAIQTIATLENIEFKNAIEVYKDLSKSKAIKIEQYEKERPVIKFKYKPFSDNHKFKEFKLPAEYLNNQDDIFNATTYWHNGIQYRHPCIAYLCNGNVKLYFRGRSYLKFITNFTKNDIMLFDKVDWDKPILAISKARLESAILDYHYGIQSIVQLNERVMLPDKILKELKIYKDSGGRVITLMDNDKTGHEMNKKYEKLGFEVYIPNNDVAQDYIDNNLKQLINEIHNR